MAREMVQPLTDQLSLADSEPHVLAGQPGLAHSPKLGLVCITASDQVRFRTITRKRLLQLSAVEQPQVLRGLYADNLRRLDAALEFCETHQIELYRLSSGLFPFADCSIGAGVLTEFEETLSTIGQRAIASNIRLVLHPEQFVVLNSDRPEVIENSIKLLDLHGQVFDWLGLQRSPWAAITLHGGKANRDERLIQVICNLPPAIGSRLVLENDEYAYSAAEILRVCQAAGIPMVFDAHHHAVNQHLSSYEDPTVAEMLAAARATWPEPSWQLVHISNGRDFFTDPHHSDLITQMPTAYYQAPWIEVEAKHKEIAIAKLRVDWLSPNGGVTSQAPG